MCVCLFRLLLVRVCVGGAKNNKIKNTKIVGDDFRSLLDKLPHYKNNKSSKLLQNQTVINKHCSNSHTHAHTGSNTGEYTLNMGVFVQFNDLM